MAAVTKGERKKELKTVVLSELEVICLLHKVRDPKSFCPFPSFNKDPLGTYYVPGIIPGLEDIAVNKTEAIPLLMNLIFYWV